MEHLTCTASAFAAGERQWGTALPKPQILVLLEFCGRWDAKAFERWDDHPAAKAHIGAYLDRLAPRARFHFIKNDQTRGLGTIRLFVVDTRLGQCRRFEVAGFDPIPALDLAAGGVAHDAPIILVCTHGRRDPCCARFGLTLYRALSDLAPELTWQTTHLGGHRFAPTLAVLPFGEVYGRVPESAAHALVSASRAGRILPDPSLMRGKMGWPEAAQVAAIALRAELGLFDPSALRLKGCAEPSKRHFVVQLEHVDPDGRGRVYERRVWWEPGAVPIQGACHQPDKLKPAKDWHIDT